MSADVQGRITSENLLNILNGVAQDKNIPIAVQRVRAGVAVVPIAGRFNIFIITSGAQGIVPADAEESVGKLYYKKDGHLFVTEDIDSLFLSSPDRVAELLFSPAVNLITALPAAPAFISGSLQTFGLSLLSKVEQALNQAKIDLDNSNVEVRNTEDRLVSLQRMNNNFANAESDLTDRSNGLQRIGWASQENFLAKLVPSMYERFELRDNGDFVGITHNLWLGGTDEEGDHYEYDFGQFAVTLVQEYGGISVKANGYDFNIYSDGDESYYHPHIDTDGTICMGDMQDSLQDARNEMDILAIFSLVHQVISSYCADAPYKPISAWS